MGKWCLHASLFIFDRIIIKVAGNEDKHKSLVEFDFGLNQTTHFGVTCPWVTKIPHFWTWISLKPVGQSWSNFMCSIIGVGERLHKVLGQIDLGTLDSGDWLLPFGLLVGRTLRLLPCFMCANSEGSGETAQMRRLTWAFAGHLCVTYHNLMSWLIYLFSCFLQSVTAVDSSDDNNSYWQVKAKTSASCKRG